MPTLTHRTAVRQSQPQSLSFHRQHHSLAEEDIQTRWKSCKTPAWHRPLSAPRCCWRNTYRGLPRYALSNIPRCTLPQSSLCFGVSISLFASFQKFGVVVDIAPYRQIPFVLNCRCIFTVIHRCKAVYDTELRLLSLVFYFADL